MFLNYKIVSINYVIVFIVIVFLYMFAIYIFYLFILLLFFFLMNESPLIPAYSSFYILTTKSRQKLCKGFLICVLDIVGKAAWVDPVA